jgi:tRNA-Thr(GGU) m(6)t(6)A37 methyltransferase TsaA
MPDSKLDFEPPRPGEVVIKLPATTDAGVYFIGQARTPWPTPADCPKSSRRRTDVIATLEISERFAAGLKDVGLYSHLIVLYWLHLSRRDLIEQVPSHLTAPRGVFALRSPVRPNPIGFAVVEVVAVEGHNIRVRNLDCADGTPIIDIKPYYAQLDSQPDATRPG